MFVDRPAGVTIVDAFAIGNTVRMNSIHDNRGPGIDLKGDGVSLNDADDSDAGPNAMLNTPLSVTAYFDGTNTTITSVMSPDPGRMTRWAIDITRIKLSTLPAQDRRRALPGYGRCYT